MTGYELTNKWYEFKFDNPARVRHIHSDMFFYVVYLWNKLGRKKEFGLPTEATMESLGIGSYNTYKNTLNDLIAFRAIRLVKDSKNQHHAKIIALSFFDEANNEATDKAKVGLSNSDEAINNPPDEAPDEPTDTIDKELKNRSKEESNRDISLVGSNETTEKPQEKVETQKATSTPKQQKYSEDFEVFWKLYDKADAGGKKQCYDERNETLKLIGYSSYKEYLDSPDWLKIREECLARDNHECVACGSPASQVHHMDYHIRTILGLRPWRLASICGKCHEAIEWTGTEKNSVNHATFLLYRMVEENGRYEWIHMVKDQQAHARAEERKNDRIGRKKTEENELNRQIRAKQRHRKKKRSTERWNSEINSGMIKPVD